ncbi:MAG: hypothetical protein KJ956_14680 [Actinobacteria bacterium]|nr:hypothetical protein [Actinomycetota bacterium]
MDKEKEELITHHLENCYECSSEFADYIVIVNAISNSTPSIWHEKHNKFVPYTYIRRVAILLMTFSIAWGIYYFVNINRELHSKEKVEVLSLITKNLQYRNLLSESSLVITRQMEYKLAIKTGLERQIKDLHSIEILCENKEYSQAIIRQKKFLSDYPKTLLQKYVYMNLAYTLKTSKRYKDAIGYFKNILKQPIQEQERGKLLWNLSKCYLKLNLEKQYLTTVDRLGTNISYSQYYWKAIRSKADYEFQKYNFLKAEVLYSKYLENNQKIPYIAEKLSWIKYHKNENFYPLILFVQAKQKGIDAYYGLKIILSQYPDSPLALHAFKMCLSPEYLNVIGNEIPSFPIKHDTNKLISYFSDLSMIQSLCEISDYALYRKAILLEKEQKYELAYKVYIKIVSKQEDNTLGKISKKAILRLSKQRRSI